MLNPKDLDIRTEVFRARCAERGLALTHQRWVIYRTLAGTDSHPTPESIFDQVRRQIPSISLATIYNNIRIFLDAGLLREVRTPQPAMRLDANLDSHHHLVCSRCGTILDLPPDSLEPFRLRKNLPKGFRLESYNVNFLGLCGECAPHVKAST
jgi:Fur family peroxide stress response transcriptional regulator